MDNGKHEQMLRVAKDKIKSSANDPAVKWIAKFNLYNILQSDADLINGDAVLQSFCDSVTPTIMCQLYKVNKIVGNGSPDLTFAEGVLKGLTAKNIVEQNLMDAFVISIAHRKRYCTSVIIRTEP